MAKKTLLPLRFLILLFISGLLLIVVNASGALDVQAETLCGICNKPITHGQYVTLGDQTYHKSCFDNTPRCQLCGFPITDDYVEDGLHQKFHRSCYQRASICALCGGVITTGSFVKTESGQVYHQHCFKTAPKCALCGLPLDAFYINHNGKRYHEQCFQQTAKCDVCQAPLKGEYFIDLYGRKFCQKHVRRKQCTICKYPVVKTRLNDGRYLCRKCYKSAVFHMNIAEYLVRQVKKDLQKLFDLTITEKIHLHLVSLSDLKKMQYSLNTSLQGKFVRETKSISVVGGGTKIIEDRFNIYVLYGLPEGLFRGVLAHELTHAWQALHCPPEQSEELKEGTAELVSYLYLQSKGDLVWMKRIENNEVALYRESFKRAYQIYKEAGQDRFFRQVTKMYTF